jgi:hypothetical protein
MERVRKTLKKYFIPHEENNHKPHILRFRAVAFVLVVAVAFEAIFWFGAPYLASRSRLFGVVLVNSLIDGTNQNRITAGEQPLVVNPLLMAAAQDKADDMIANNYFAHTSPSGLSPWYWFEQVGYNFTYAGENLAVNFSDSADVTNAWMNSAEHRANILNANFTEIGMATATGTYEGNPAVYVVELFGTPAPAAPAASPLPFVSAAGAEASPSAVAEGPASAGKISRPQGVVLKKSSPATSSAAASPVVIASTGIESASSAQSFIAVRANGTGSPATAVGKNLRGTLAPDANPIQSALADPRQTIDYLYLGLMALFAVALGLNVFVKVRVQHADVIFGGILVILVAGFLILLNQQALIGIAIL